MIPRYTNQAGGASHGNNEHELLQAFVDFSEMQKRDIKETPMSDIDHAPAKKSRQDARKNNTLRDEVVENLSMKEESHSLERVLASLGNERPDAETNSVSQNMSEVSDSSRSSFDDGALAESRKVTPKPRTASVPGTETLEEASASTSSDKEDTAKAANSFELPPQPPELDFLATLLEQYRVESLLWGQVKQRDDIEGNKYHLEVLQEKIAKYQALPEIEAYVTRFREATIQAIRHRQSNCSRTLLCVLNKKCGFGCQLHHAVHCFTNAVATRRALVLQVHPWSYSSHFETYFHPVSECSPDLIPKEQRNRRSFHENHDHAFLNIVDHDVTGFEPPFLPPDVMSHVRKFHTEPHVWWVGVLSAYLMDLMDPSIITYPPAPYTALHVRRTDKVGKEADFHALDEYMPRVRHQNVYLATDDPSVLEGAKIKYPEYNFYENLAGAEAAKVSSRYTDASLEGLLQDVFVLAHADYLVGTFSSQISRLGYELAQTLHVDSIYKAHSIDGGYYFGGWIPFQQCLIEDYRGFPRGYAIQYDLGASERTGFLKDEKSQEHFPFHLTETCSPFYANLLSDKEVVAPPQPPPPPAAKAEDGQQMDKDDSTEANPSQIQNDPEEHKSGDSPGMEKEQDREGAGDVVSHPKHAQRIEHRTGNRPNQGSARHAFPHHTGKHKGKGRVHVKAIKKGRRLEILKE